MKTYSVKKSEIKRNWYLVDVKNQYLGRIATQVATLLRGKHKSEFTPNQDCGDFVVVINTDRLKFSGKKLEQKEYIHHTGYPGKVKRKTLKDQFKEDSTQVFEKAVFGMLPANRLKNEQLKRLKIYKDDKHKHTQRLIKVTSNQ